MQQSSLVKWVDELQAQIDQVKRSVENIPAPPAPPTTYTRETVFEDEEVTVDSSTGKLIEETLPTGTVYVFVKLYTTFNNVKQVRYSAIFDAADFTGEVRISFSDLLLSTTNLEALYQFNIEYGETGFTVIYNTIIPEGTLEKDVFMDLYAFTTDEQPTTTKRKKKK